MLVKAGDLCYLREVACFYTVTPDKRHGGYRPIGDITTDNVDIKPQDAVLVVDVAKLTSVVTHGWVGNVTGKLQVNFAICLWDKWLLAIDRGYLQMARKSQEI